MLSKNGPGVKKNHDDAEEEINILGTLGRFINIIVYIIIYYTYITYICNNIL